MKKNILLFSIIILATNSLRCVIQKPKKKNDKISKQQKKIITLKPQTLKLKPITIKPKAIQLKPVQQSKENIIPTKEESLPAKPAEDKPKPVEQKAVSTKRDTAIPTEKPAEDTSKTTTQTTEQDRTTQEETSKPTTNQAEDTNQIPTQPTQTLPQQQPQPLKTISAANYPTAIGIFNNTNDTIIITNISFFEGASFYDLLNSQAITVSDSSCQVNADCKLGYCQPNGQCTKSLEPNAYWKGTYTSSSNYKYVSGFIQYEVNGKQYTSKIFSINNQNAISILFYNDAIKILEWDTYNQNICVNNTRLCPAKCTENDPAIDKGECGCAHYPDSANYTGSCLSETDQNFNPEQIVVRPRNLR